MFFPGSSFAFVDCQKGERRRSRRRSRREQSSWSESSSFTILYRLELPPAMLPTTAILPPAILPLLTKGTFFEGHDDFIAPLDTILPLSLSISPSLLLISISHFQFNFHFFHFPFHFQLNFHFQPRLIFQQVAPLATIYRGDVRSFEKLW